MLTIAGIITLSRAHKKNLLIATIPLLFAVQQFCEGFVWLSLTHEIDITYLPFFSYSFLFFVFIVWPVCIPMSLYYAEQNALRKKYIRVCFVIGCLVALLLLGTLFIYRLKTTILEHHIFYHLDISYVFSVFGSILYLIATVIPFFISSIRLSNYFGSVLALSYLVSFYFYYMQLVSVWCFFVAILSVLVFFIV